MAIVYTHGVWNVKQGHADEFVAAWRDFADWSLANAPGAMWAKLLRDANDDHRFVSVGPWASLDAVEGWRSLDGWSERIGRIREFLVDFTPGTLEPVVEVGAP
jgi:heme-degrading monooxygenase HmoA